MKCINCTVCKAPIDTHTNEDNQLPQQGDVSICAYCGHISVFDASLNLTPAPQHVVNAIDQKYLDIARMLSAKYSASLTKV